MEPFRVICETCRSRLKIRSPEVIGEIHECPKCGSMVHIMPPAGWTPGEPASAVATPTHAGEPALAISTTASVIIPASIAAQDFAPPEAIDAPVADVPIEVAPTAAAPVASGISPVVLWSAGALAVLLVGGATFALWPARNNKVETVAVNSSTSDPKPDAEQPKPATPAAKSADEPKLTARDAHAVDREKNKTAQAAPPAPAPPAAANKVEVAANKPPEASARSPQPPLELPKPENPNAAPPKTEIASAKPDNARIASLPAAPVDLPKPADAPAQEVPHKPVLKFDPLNFDPERLGANAAASSAPAGPTNSIPDRAPAPVVNEQAQGKAADPAANAGPVNGQPGNVPAPPAAPPSISVRRGQPVADGPAPKKPVQPLAFQFKSIQLGGMPLAQLIETLSNISGTSITFDPIALEVAAVSPQTTVSLDEQNATMETALRKVLGPQRLGFVVEGDHIRLALQKPDDRREVDYEVKDLSPGGDASGIAQLIEKFVAPSTWKSAGGGGTIQVKGTTLSVEQSDLVRRQVIIFCERLRIARGLPIRSKYPRELLSIDPPYQKLAAKLNQSTTFTFLAWTRWSDVVRQLRDMMGVSLVIDWSALDEMQLNPSSPIACSANNRSWQEALDGVLEPLGLTWWAVDAQTIQITSRTALANIHRIEFYSVPANTSAAGGQALTDSVQKEIAAAGPQGKAADVRIALDEPSGRLIVLATPDQHRLLARRFSAAKR
jgi:hypothetical protein